MTALDSAQNTIADAFAEFGGSLTVLTSFQREGIVITNLVLEAHPGTPVMTIDTGRLPAGTLEMISRVEERYGIAVERIRPDASEVEVMVALHGRDLFFDGAAQRKLCCNIRKVRPLARRMAGIAGYFTGLRKEQSETRAIVEKFDRTSSPVKISPLADWSREDVAAYTREHGLPEHSLYAAGYASIGCEPCTRAIEPGEEERAGRWWWENDSAKECGLHFTPEGKVERTVDVLLRDILTRAHV